MLRGSHLPSVRPTVDHTPDCGCLFVRLLGVQTTPMLYRGREPAVSTFSIDHCRLLIITLHADSAHANTGASSFFPAFLLPSFFALKQSRERYALAVGKQLKRIYGLLSLHVTCRIRGRGACFQYSAISKTINSLLCMRHHTAVSFS